MGSRRPRPLHGSAVKIQKLIWDPADKGGKQVVARVVTCLQTHSDLYPSGARVGYLLLRRTADSSLARDDNLMKV